MSTKSLLMDEIKARLASGDRELLVMALLQVYAGQTSHEKLVMATGVVNGKGFNKFDAEILTSFVEQWKRCAWLSDKQYALLQKKMPKYAAQLTPVVEKVEATEVYAELSEIPFDMEGFVEFSNGTKIDFDTMAPIMQEGEAVAWELTIGNIRYVIAND